LIIINKDDQGRSQQNEEQKEIEKLAYECNDVPQTRKIPNFKFQFPNKYQTSIDDGLLIFGIWFLDFLQIIS
jgi:hypothetical protein